MKNKREFLYLLNRRLCIHRDIKALSTMSGTEKEIEELEKQDRFCLEQSLELTKDWEQTPIVK